MRTAAGAALFICFMSRHAAGFIPVHGMLHGLLTADNIDRGSMVIASKVRDAFLVFPRSIRISEMDAHTLHRCSKR